MPQLPLLLLLQRLQSDGITHSLTRNPRQIPRNSSCPNSVSHMLSLTFTLLKLIKLENLLFFVRSLAISFQVGRLIFLFLADHFSDFCPSRV